MHCGQVDTCEERVTAAAAAAAVAAAAAADDDDDDDNVHDAYDDHDGRSQSQFPQLQTTKINNSKSTNTKKIAMLQRMHLKPPPPLLTKSTIFAAQSPLRPAWRLGVGLW